MPAVFVDQLHSRHGSGKKKKKIKTTHKLTKKQAKTTLQSVLLNK